MTQATELTVKIPQTTSCSYDIIIGEGLIKDLNSYLKKYTNAKKFLIVTNETIYDLYKEIIKIENPKNVHFVILKDGEEYKNFDSLKMILDSAIEHRLERRDCMIAFGGGVVGDITGYAAASYLRGVDFIQIPTTLLAQVDSSVGGKVAINHPKGKNLIGAFYQPKLVLADTDFLKTLPLRQLKTGLGEVLKYAFIEKSCNCPLNYRFFDFLHINKDKLYALETNTIIKLINICCTLKACVVQEDETEKGLRTILNFGHTFAHAVESLTQYKKYTHGEAVAIGMKMAFKLALLLELTDEDYVKATNQLIDKYELIENVEMFNTDDFIEAMGLDKKADSDKIRFILSCADFKVKTVTDVSKDLMKKAITY